MCLTRLEKFNVNGKGYVVAEKVSHDTYGPLFCNKHNHTKLKRETKAYTTRVRCDPHWEKFDDEYSSGWHILPRKADAIELLAASRNLKAGRENERYVMLQVSYRKTGVTTGWQLRRSIFRAWYPEGSLKVVVASHRTLLREVKV